MCALRSGDTLTHVKHKPADRKPQPPKTTPTGIPWGGLAIVMGVALLLRLFAVLWLRDTVPYSDYFYYHDAGRMTALDWGLWFDAERIQQFAKLSWWPPGYPMFLGMVYEIFGANHRAVVFLQVLLGTATTGFVYLIGWRVAAARGAPFARRVAFVAALLVAINPTYIFVTNLLASENLFVFYLSLGLYLALRGGTRRRDYVFVGIALVLATYARAIGILVPFVIVGAMFRSQPNRRVWRQAALWILGTYFALLLPWTVRNAVVVGSPALISHGGGINFYYGHNPDSIGYRPVAETPMRGMSDPAAVDARGRKLAMQYILQEPGGAFVRGFSKIGRLFAPPRYAMQANNAIALPANWEGDPVLEQQVEEARARQRPKSRLLRGPLTVAASINSYFLLLGFLAALFLWKRLTPEMHWMVLLSLFWVGLHVVFWAQPRFRYPLELFMAVSTASVIATLLASSRGEKSHGT